MSSPTNFDPWSPRRTRYRGPAWLGNCASELVLRAERRAGELLREMPDRRGQLEKLHDATFQPAPTYADLDIEKTAAHCWQRLGQLSDPEVERVRSELRRQFAVGVPLASSDDSRRI